MKLAIIIKYGITGACIGFLLSWIYVLSCNFEVIKDGKILEETVEFIDKQRQLQEELTDFANKQRELYRKICSED